MIAKYILTLCALFAIQDLALADPAINSETRDVIQNIRDTIQKLKDLVNTTVEDAVKQLRELLNDIIQFATQIVTKATERSNAIASGILDEIKIIKDKATKLGIDVKDCFGNQKKRILELPSLMLKELVECITRKVKEAEKIVSDSFNAITSTTAVVTGIDDAFKKCQANGSSITCLLKVFRGATPQLVKLPIKISEQIAKATKLIATIRTELAICASSKIAKLTMEVGKIGFDAGQCIADKTL